VQESETKEVVEQSETREEIIQESESSEVVLSETVSVEESSQSVEVPASPVISNGV